MGECVVIMETLENIVPAMFDHADRKAGIKRPKPRQ